MSIESLQTPGNAIRRMLEMRGWTQTILASVIGKPIPHLNGIINGKRPITAEIAIGLASAFGTEPDYWMTLESQKQLAEFSFPDEMVQQRALCYEVAPVTEMQKRGWIKETSTADGLVEELKAFFNQPELSKHARFEVSTRRTTNNEESDLSPQQLAWCYRSWQIASSLPVPQFDASNLGKCKDELKKMSSMRSEARNVAVCLAKYGVRYVIVEPLPGSSIDGAAFWLDRDSPVIAMSLRFDRIDNYWFTLFHEFSHIMNGDSLSVDCDLSGTDTSFTITKSEIERRADNEASEALVEPKKIESFIKRIKPMYSRDRIVQFANRIKVHPGVIVGQLQHRGEIGFHAHKEFLVKIRDVVTPTAVTDGWGFSISNTTLKRDSNAESSKNTK